MRKRWGIMCLKPPIAEGAWPSQIWGGEIRCGFCGGVLSLQAHLVTVSSLFHIMICPVSLMCVMTLVAHGGPGFNATFHRGCMYKSPLWDLNCSVFLWSLDGKRVEYCFESTVSEERAHWVLRQTRWVLRKTRWVCIWTQKNWEELTELSPRNSARAKKLTELGVWNRTLRNNIRPVYDRNTSTSQD